MSPRASTFHIDASKFQGRKLFVPYFVAIFVVNFFANTYFSSGFGCSMKAYKHRIFWTSAASSSF